MDTFTLGGFVARLLLPFFVVSLLCLTIARGRLHGAIALFRTRAALICMLGLFFLLSLAAATKTSATTVPDVELPDRQMQVLFEKTSCYEIAIDKDPPWQHRAGVSGRAPALFVGTPPLVAPRIAMAVIDNQVQWQADVSKLAKIAIAVASHAYGVTIPVESNPATYGQLSGLQAAFAGTLDDEAVAVQVFVGVNPGGQVYTLHAHTQSGMQDHLQQTTRRIWNTLSFPCLTVGGRQQSSPAPQ